MESRSGVHLLREGEGQVVGEGEEDVVHLQHVEGGPHAGCPSAHSWFSSTPCPLLRGGPSGCGGRAVGLVGRPSGAVWDRRAVRRAEGKQGE